LETDCTSCAHPRYFSENQCVDECPAGKWRNPITVDCQPCVATNCDSCEPHISMCENCATGFFMVANGNCVNVNKLILNI